MNKITAEKLQELNDQHLENVKALFAADSLIAEYKEFADKHGLAVIASTCCGNVVVFAMGNANHLISEFTKVDHPIISGDVHLVDEFYISNIGG